MNIYISLFLFVLIFIVAMYLQQRFNIDMITIASLLIILLYAGNVIDYQFGLIGIIILFYSFYRGLKKNGNNVVSE